MDQADIRPIAGSATATVDDEGLANGITGGAILSRMTDQAQEYGAAVRAGRAACAQAGVAMVFAARRHFRH